jgi:hypothetical protein
MMPFRIMLKGIMLFTMTVLVLGELTDKMETFQNYLSIHLTIIRETGILKCRLK